MILHKKHTYLSLIALSALAACGKSDVSTLPSQTLSVNATTDIETPTLISQVTVVPNLVASWYSQIIMLAEDGTLYRTTLNSRTSKPIGTNTYTDIYGLVRDGQAGVFLAVDSEHRLHAYVEVDDNGRFEPLSVTPAAANFSKFCTNASPKPDQSVFALGTDKTLYELSVIVMDQKALSFEIISEKRVSDKITHCTLSANGDVLLSDNALLKDMLTPMALPDAPQHYIGASASGSNMALRTSESETHISIEDGLSISGVSAPSLVFVTDLKMGSAYNDGVIIASDATQPRIVVIARDYFMNVVTADKAL